MLLSLRGLESRSHGIQETVCSLPERENLAIRSDVRHELLEILVIQFVEQLLDILWVEPEDLVDPGTGEGLTDSTAVSVTLHMDDQLTFGVKGSLSDTTLGIHADIASWPGMVISASAAPLPLATVVSQPFPLR